MVSVKLMVQPLWSYVGVVCNVKDGSYVDVLATAVEPGRTGPTVVVGVVCVTSGEWTEPALVQSAVVTERILALPTWTLRPLGLVTVKPANAGIVVATNITVVAVSPTAAGTVMLPCPSA